MPKGGMGRKRDMGYIRELLNWAVLEKKYLAMEWLPITSRQFRKYIGAGAGPRIVTFWKLGDCFFKLISNSSSSFWFLDDIIIDANFPNGGKLTSFLNLVSIFKNSSLLFSLNASITWFFGS